MRIIFTNPDSMGDLILREPLYRALEDNRHELLLLVRPELLSIVKYIAPSAAAFEVPFNPYECRPRANDAEAMHSLVERVKAWRPDVLAFAPWQWTYFDEWLSSELPSVPVVGHTGKCSGDPSGRTRQAFIRQIDTDIDLHELEKNRRLAEAFSATIPAERRPEIHPSQDGCASASRLLKRVGLEHGNYWIAVIGENANRLSHLRNWALDLWAEALVHGVHEHGWRYLLVGAPDELDAVRRVRNLAGSPAEIVLQDSLVDMDALFGLTSFSQGYIGRDTGPMHLAAALDRPILALFGGGHWARFTPVANAAIVLTMEVPCARCEWNCVFSDSHCIKQIPLEAVTSAMDDLANGVQGVDLRVLQRTPAMFRRMERDAVERLKAGRVIQEELQARVELLKTELNISRKQNEDLLTSRWIRLGRALGVAKPVSSY